MLQRTLKNFIQYLCFTCLFVSAMHARQQVETAPQLIPSQLQDAFGED